MMLAPALAASAVLTDAGSVKQSFIDDARAVFGSLKNIVPGHPIAGREAHHDRVLAATSHLPHVLAFTMVDTLATQQEAEEIFRYAAGGFRDFTRIASSDPVMWRDICLTNREAVLASVDAFSEHLVHLREVDHSTDHSVPQSAE